MTVHVSFLVGATAAARTLRERISALPGQAVEPPCGRGEAAVERWRGILDRGGPHRFARRLRWDGLDLHGLRNALYAAPHAAPAPDWALLLADACDAAAGKPGADPALDPADPVPFEEVLLPFVQAGRKRLACSETAGRVFAPDARVALERALLAELSALAAQALVVDLGVARARQGSATLCLGAPGRAGYRAFVEGLRAARLEPLVARYPVLARLLAVRTALWARASAELAARAAADAAELGARFGGGDPGAVTALHTGRGETHCAGRTVARVRFASGLEVMYKPRSLKLDLAFYRLLGWLAERGLEPAHRCLAVLDRGEYGWVELVRAAPAANADELREYYERAGALLCLTTLLGAGDLHSENLIAAGAHPVPVDLETVMGAPVQGAAAREGGSHPVATPRLMGTGLLPYWQAGAEGQLLFGGGLGPPSERHQVVERGWAFVNTDAMRRERRVSRAPTEDNVPRLEGRPVPPSEHVEDLVRGLERCHAFLEAHRDALSAPGGPLEGFRGQRVRVLLRDTRVYGAAIQRSLHPTALQDGVEHGLQLEVLRGSALAGEEPLPYWGAFEAEQRDLEELDYPYFSAFTDGTVLHDSRGREVGAFCARSAYDQTVARLARLDADDRREQAALVRFAYACYDGPAATAAAPRSGDRSGDLPLGAAEALAEARAIAGALESLAQHGIEGSAGWVGVDRSDPGEGDALRPLGDRLYDGRAGVALFLAAADVVAGTGHAELAARALLPLRRTLRDPHGRAALAGRMGIGAGLGLGGIVYALTQIGRLTGDGAWMDDARLAALAITPESIAADGELEVLGGAAGAALALVALHEATGDPQALALAAACGRRLVAAAEVEPVTCARAWRLHGGRFAGGFAHGAGGIGAALLRLAAATGDGAFAAAGAGAFAFAESALEPHPTAAGHVAAAAGKQPSGTGWAASWCNGPIGVALGGVLEGRTAAPRTLFLAASGAVDGSPDHPCCGVLGRAELLLASGDLAGAAALAGRVVGRARAARTYHIARDVPEARYSPAFFQGLSGIGYQILRITHPGRLPSVLAFR